MTPVRAHSDCEAVGDEPAHGSLPDHNPRNWSPYNSNTLPCLTAYWVVALTVNISFTTYLAPTFHVSVS